MENAHMIGEVETVETDRHSWNREANGINWSFEEEAYVVTLYGVPRTYDGKTCEVALLFTDGTRVCGPGLVRTPKRKYGDADPKSILVLRESDSTLR